MDYNHQRFTTIDTMVMVKDLQSVVIGHRLINIYDLNDSTFLFKFAVPGNEIAANATTIARDDDGEDANAKKLFLLVESGIRFHTTVYVRDKSDTPNPFAMKLRKHLKTKRIESITQLGNDRVVDFKFGAGENVNHIIVELYGNGNIILCNNNYEILALLRTHQYEVDVISKVGELYPVAFSTSIQSTSFASNSSPVSNVSSFIAWAQQKVRDNKAWFDGQLEKGKKVKFKQLSLKQLLLKAESGLSSYSEILQHSLVTVGVKMSMKVEELLTYDTERIKKILASINENSSSMLSLINTPSRPGYIIYRERPSHDQISKEPAKREYIDFTTMLFRQHDSFLSIECKSFNEAADRYFSSLESQKLELQAQQVDDSAKKKLERVRNDKEQYIKSLALQQKKLERSAMLIEMHADSIDKVSLVVNSALDSGMSWGDLAEMVEAEAERGNPIASLIRKLNLEKRRVTLRLVDECIYDNDSDDDGDDDDSDGDNEDDNDGEDEGNLAKKSKATANYEDVEIDLNQSAHANARLMYSSKKITQVKETKTILATEKSLAIVEEQTMRQIEKQKLKRSLLSKRKVHWFEKFHWFISSDGFLVISGRDPYQNEILVKQYVRLGDICVHADIAGAPICVVRCKIPGVANKPASAIGPIALQEAGVASICRSTAWTSKAVVSAWWVWSNQIQVMSTGGSFLVQGKKHYLPPSNLEMGFGILWRLDDESISKHANDRRKDYSTALMDDETASYMTEQFDRYGIAEVNPDEMNALDAIAEDDGDSDGDGEASVVEAAQLTEVLIPTKSSKSVASHQQKRHGKHGKGEANSKGTSTSASITTTTAPTAATAVGTSSKKKHINKKKAHRYAEQDDEDRELAMIALGHGTESLKHMSKQTKSEQLTLAAKQDKAGVSLLIENWDKTFAALGETVQLEIEALLRTHVLKKEEVDADELKTLGTFTVDDAVFILNRFKEGVTNDAAVNSDTVDSSHKAMKVRNKSGFLAGIMRKCRSDNEKKRSIASMPVKVEEVLLEVDTHASAATAGDGTNAVTADTTADADAHGDDDHNVAFTDTLDDLDQFTGSPYHDDQLMYALSVCAPYGCFKNTKYKVKLLPGTLKKGKACKSSIDLFTRLKECTQNEEDLLKAITDAEMVASILGDVKLSMPGLQIIKRDVKKTKKKGNHGR